MDYLNLLASRTGPADFWLEDSGFAPTVLVDSGLADSGLADSGMQTLETLVLQTGLARIKCPSGLSYPSCTTHSVPIS